jgi:8-oxo-dGTP pyrophosphatase MutT (NUDIX family)
MITTYARQPFPSKVAKSIFLAGPTPRAPQPGQKPTPSWRTEALKLLEELGYDGHVFVPEPQDGKWADNYDEQLEWEEEALNRADCIVFWIPRDLKTLPGFTTNDEWGVWKHSGKVVLGTPPKAPKTRYQRIYAKKLQVPLNDRLKDTLKAAVDMVGEGAVRIDAEAQVPLYIWKEESFQKWYRSQLSAGNVLQGARLLWVSVMPKVRRVFCWALKVEVYIASEDRVKSNEFVFGRPDISSVILWYRAPTLADTQVVLVKEFRSPGRTKDGFVREPPGGSSAPGTKPLDTAVEEVEEEAGLKIKPQRLKAYPLRQMYGTLSSVGANVFSAEISRDELEFLRSQAGQPHGIEEDSERTFVEIYRVGDLLKQPLTDWATLGMIFSALSDAMR